MTKEEIEFKKECDETLQSIYSKINEEEKIFLSYVINQFNNVCERNNKAIEYIEKHKQIYDIDGTIEHKIDEFNILASPRILIEILKGSDKE